MINVAAAVIVNKDGKILVTQRSNDKLSLKWNFQVEKLKTAEEVLKRRLWKS